MIKKLINIMFESNEENVSVFLDNIQTIHDLVESSSNLIDIYNWFHLTNKLHDYFKSIKAKTNVLNVSWHTKKNLDIIFIFNNLNLFIFSLQPKIIILSIP